MLSNAEHTDGEVSKKVKEISAQHRDSTVKEAKGYADSRVVEEGGEEEAEEEGEEEDEEWEG